MMKSQNKRYWTLVLLIILTINSNGQPLEQKKKQQEVLKIEAEVMNAIEIEKVKLMDNGQNIDALAMTLSLLSDTTSHLDRYTISSSTAKKFTDWPYGRADIFMLIYNPKGAPSKHKVGTIKADGSFEFSLPEDIEIQSKMGDFFKCRYVESPTETIYLDPATGLAHGAGMQLVQNGEVIGTLSLASSQQQAYNNSPYGQYRGDPGYRLEWWYAEGQTSAKVSCKRMNSEQYEIQSIYDLAFKQGWNYMKIEIAESHSKEMYKTKKYSVVPSLPDNVKWVFNHF